MGYEKLRNDANKLGIYSKSIPSTVWGDTTNIKSKKNQTGIYTQTIPSTVWGNQDNIIDLDDYDETDDYEPDWLNMTDADIDNYIRDYQLSINPQEESPAKAAREKMQTDPITKFSNTIPVSLADSSPYAQVDPKSIQISRRNVNVTKDLLLSLVPLLTRYGCPVRITSLERPKAKTSNGSVSFHDGGHAMDIVPTDGNFIKLLHLLKTNPHIRLAMKDIGVGYIDETTKEMLARTGGTGPHIHIGPDNFAIKTFNLA